MLSVPGAKTVRGWLFFGDSFVYALSEDGIDLYSAPSCVLAGLSQGQSRLPPGATASWGPTPPASARFTSTRWWTVAARWALASQLRALPDWLPKFELKMPPNVAQPRWVAC